LCTHIFESRGLGSCLVLNCLAVRLQTHISSGRKGPVETSYHVHRWPLSLGAFFILASRLAAVCCHIPPIRSSSSRRAGFFDATDSFPAVNST
jgi:hypothetical protein